MDDLDRLAVMMDRQGITVHDLEKAMRDVEQAQRQGIPDHQIVEHITKEERCRN
jgi:hypothetical protein